MCQSTTARMSPDRSDRPSNHVRPSCADIPVMTDPFEAAFQPDPSRVGDMRRTTAALLQRAGLPEVLVGDVVLAVSELVTNAIVHGDGEVSLHVSVESGEVRVSVSDRSPDRAVLVEADADRESGRGVRLVAAFSHAWGSKGTETWCSFRFPPETVRKVVA